MSTAPLPFPLGDDAEDDEEDAVGEDGEKKTPDRNEGTPALAARGDNTEDDDEELHDDDGFEGEDAEESGGSTYLRVRCHRSSSVAVADGVVVVVVVVVVVAAAPSRRRSARPRRRRRR